MNWTTICLSWPRFFSYSRCARSIHISLVSISSFSSRKQFTLSSHSSQVSFFPSFIPLIHKFFLLKRSSWSTSFLSISITQLGLVVWMTSMSFLRLNRYLSIEVIFSFNLLNFPSVSSWVNSNLSFRSEISLLRLSGLWFVSVVFPEINWLCYFHDFWTFHPVFSW